MRFTDTLAVSEYFELARYGQLVLTAEARPYQFTHTSAPSIGGYAAITGRPGRPAASSSTTTTTPRTTP